MKDELSPVRHFYGLDSIWIYRLAWMDNLELVALIDLEEIPEPEVHARRTDLLKYIVFRTGFENYIARL